MSAPTGSEYIERPKQPRIGPVDPTSLTPQQRALAGIGASAVILTLVRRPELLEGIIPLGTKLLGEGRLPARARELVILRVALRTECAYEWGNHVPGALAAGATTDEIVALTRESSSSAASDDALLRATDEQCADNRISAHTWAALRETLDDGELIELLLLIGYYRMMAGFLNSVGVTVEPGRAPLGELPETTITATPPVRPTTGPGPIDGTWAITFHHPAADQHLILELHDVDGKVTGAVTNPALDITVSIQDGAVEQSRVTGTTVMTEPIAATLEWDGTVSGDSIVGEVTIVGTGTFPFDGKRN